MPCVHSTEKITLKYISIFRSFFSLPFHYFVRFVRCGRWWLADGARHGHSHFLVTNLTFINNIFFVKELKNSGHCSSHRTPSSAFNRRIFCAQNKKRNGIQFFQLHFHNKSLAHIEWQREESWSRIQCIRNGAQHRFASPSVTAELNCKASTRTNYHQRPEKC